MKKQRHNVQLRISWLLLIIWGCFGLLLVRFAWLQLGMVTSWRSGQ